MVLILLLVLLFVSLLVLVFVIGSLKTGNIVLFVSLMMTLLNCLWICSMSKRHYYVTNSLGSVFMFDSLRDVSSFLYCSPVDPACRMVSRREAEVIFGHRFSSHRVLCLPVDNKDYSFTYFQFFAC